MDKPVPTQMSDDEFQAFLEENEYTNIRKLPDGTWAALIRLAFTIGMCTGLTEYGLERRFCYENLAEALGALQALNAWDEEPEKTYVARRPKND